MIKRLKKKFIALSMISLTLLLAAIVAGMNIINYSKVVSDADARLDVLEQNQFSFRDDPGRPGQPGKLFGKDGRGGRSMTQDEAEELRFFTVVIDEDGNAGQIDTGRISAVDEVQAKEYAEEVLAKGTEHGFADEYRYSVRKTDSASTVTFLDCGRVLRSFRDFLMASILMSLAGLLLVFLVISYFAERIVKPVAESYEKQKRFITDAGHEIKTPLAIIKANLDVIRMDPDSTDESLEEIGHQVDRLAGLTDDLVYLSRMEEKKERNILTEIPFSDVVSDTVSSFGVLAENRGRHIRVRIEPMIFIRGNVKDLEKLVSILMENAVKYSAGDDPIVVSLIRKDRDCVLQVENSTDKAISQEDVDHIFDRFYRMDESRNSKTGGYGIGLSMAEAIVASCGGKISADAGEGNRFAIKTVFPVLDQTAS